MNIQPDTVILVTSCLFATAIVLLIIAVRICNRDNQSIAYLMEHGFTITRENVVNVEPNPYDDDDSPIVNTRDGLCFAVSCFSRITKGDEIYVVHKGDSVLCTHNNFGSAARQGAKKLETQSLAHKDNVEQPPLG